MTVFSNLKNLAQTVMDEAVTSTASIWVLADVSALPGIAPYYITCENEVVKVTSFDATSNHVYVSRSQDDTSAAAHSKFDSVEQRITKVLFTDIHGAVNSLETQTTSLIGYTAGSAALRVINVVSAPVSIPLAGITYFDTTRKVALYSDGTSMFLATGSLA